MKQIFKNLYPLSKELRFIGEKEEFKTLTAKTKEELFTIKWKSKDKFEITPTISVGTIYSHLYHFPIKVYGYISKAESNVLKINLATKFRGEHIFFASVLILITLGGIFISWIFTLVILLIPISLLWFGFVYRGQEEQLCTELRKTIYRHHLQTGKIKIDKKGRLR